MIIIVIILIVIILASGWPAVCPPSGHAQVAAPAPEPQRSPVCRSSPQPDDKSASTSTITFAELKFEADLRLSQTEQDQVAASIQQHHYDYSGAAEGTVDEIQQENTNRLAGTRLFSR